MTDTRRYVAAHRDELISDLSEWLRIPSISAQPEHHPDVARSALWLAEAARRTGFPTVQIWDQGPWLPAVWAEWPSADPGAPTVLVYAHHDVQPVDPREAWTTDPFAPTVDGDHIHGRGASDDKGQVLFHLLGLRAHLAGRRRDTPAVTVKMLIEGDEESGSPHLAQLLDQHREQLDCDVLVVTDSAMIAADRPSVLTGLRGLVAATVTFHGPDVDLHSGLFGGAVPNPATALARLLSALHDEHEHIQVPGFYDHVRDLVPDEKELLARLPVTDREFLATARSRALQGEVGYTTLERIGTRPTADVNAS